MPNDRIQSNESPRVIAHRRFLANLNADIERPVIIPLETLYTVPATIPVVGDRIVMSYPVPSNKDLFISALTGFIELTPVAAPGTVDDPTVALLDNTLINVYNDNDKEYLSTDPITMSQIVGGHRRIKPVFKFPGLWRVPASDSVIVEFTMLPGWLVALRENDVRRLGVALIGIIMRQEELIAYGRIAPKLNGAAKGA